MGLQEYKEFVHFGLTSQDINNTAIPLSLKEFSKTILTKNIDSLLETLKELADKTKDISIISRTHGQPASPTKLGKEIFVFITRINISMKILKKYHLLQNLLELQVILMPTLFHIQTLIGRLLPMNL